MRYAVLAGELPAPLGRTGSYGRKFEPFVLARTRDDPIGYEIGAYDTETNLSHITVMLYYSCCCAALHIQR